MGIPTCTAKKTVKSVDPIRRIKMNRILVNLSREPSKRDIICKIQMETLNMNGALKVNSHSEICGKYRCILVKYSVPTLEHIS